MLLQPLLVKLHTGPVQPQLLFVEWVLAKKEEFFHEPNRPFLRHCGMLLVQLMGKDKGNS